MRCGQKGWGWKRVLCRLRVRLWGKRNCRWLRFWGCCVWRWLGVRLGLAKQRIVKEAEARHATLEDVEQHARRKIAERLDARLLTCGPRHGSQ